MDENEDRTQAQPQLFRAVLRPNRSLSPAGFVVFMTAVAGASLVTGVLFYMIGAWPVSGFYGLDVLLLYVAFKASYRSGRLYETVELTPDRLVVTRVHPSGRRERFDWNPYWTWVRLHEARDGRTDLRLASRGSELAFGRFLTDTERRDFAAALKEALAEARSRTRF
jgi:uncharacterized membrane protein